MGFIPCTARGLSPRSPVPDNHTESYSRQCRAKFIQEYENNEIRSPSSIPTCKWPHSAIDDDDEEYE
jgi:hypothetical protein